MFPQTALILTIVGVPKLLYHIIWKKNIKALIVLAAAQIHSGVIAQKNIIFNKFMRWCAFEEWYDSFTVIQEDEVVDKEKVLFSWMPHSIAATVAIFTRNLKELPYCNSILVGSRMAIKSPFFGTLFQWSGVYGANPASFDNLMSKNKNISFVPGGFEEATITDSNDYRLWIKERKGFIKYSLQYGYKVHPVFVFNEIKGYFTSDFLLKQRIWLNKYKLPGITQFSKYGIMPEKNLDIYVVIGRAIQIPKIENPQQEDIDKYHDIYLEEIQRIFNTYSQQYHPGSRLKLWGPSKNYDPEDKTPKPKL